MNNIGACKNEVRHSKDKALIKVLDKLSDINNGTATLIIQDGVLVQYNICKRYEDIFSKSINKVNNIVSFKGYLDFFKGIISEVPYGQIIINLKDGQIATVEREEKIRVK